LLIFIIFLPKRYFRKKSKKHNRCLLPSAKRSNLPADLAAGTGAIVKDPVQDTLVWREYLETAVQAPRRLARLVPRLYGGVVGLFGMVENGAIFSLKKVIAVTIYLLYLCMDKFFRIESTTR
jgi:hypothetical protein